MERGEVILVYTVTLEGAAADHLREVPADLIGMRIGGRASDLRARGRALELTGTLIRAASADLGDGAMGCANLSLEAGE